MQCLMDALDRGADTGQGNIFLLSILLWYFPQIKLLLLRNEFEITKPSDFKMF